MFSFLKNVNLGFLNPLGAGDDYVALDIGSSSIKLVETVVDKNGYRALDQRRVDSDEVLTGGDRHGRGGVEGSGVFVPLLLEAGIPAGEVELVGPRRKTPAVVCRCRPRPPRTGSSATARRPRRQRQIGWMN